MEIKFKQFMRSVLYFLLMLIARPMKYEFKSNRRTITVEGTPEGTTNQLEESYVLRFKYRWYSPFCWIFIIAYPLGRALGVFLKCFRDELVCLISNKTLMDGGSYTVSYKVPVNQSNRDFRLGQRYVKLESWLELVYVWLG